ncbi:hypothetical protein HY492_02545 [Candidatus Woesearchaeota archaeon]|nr:hypothetical protein [Candidatus Woesearchaeota archaeon]
MLHTYRTTGPGKEYHALDLKLLYPEKENRVSFEQRWKLFHASHPDNAQVFRKTNDSLGYISENIIPAQADSRVPALLLFGNPAPQSALAGMFFSYEGAGREHRVWKIFRETQFLHFDELPEARSQVNVSMRKKPARFELSFPIPYRYECLFLHAKQRKRSRLVGSCRIAPSFWQAGISPHRGRGTKTNSTSHKQICQ